LNEVNKEIFDLIKEKEVEKNFTIYPPEFPKLTKDSFASFFLITTDNSKFDSSNIEKI